MNVPSQRRPPGPPQGSTSMLAGTRCKQQATGKRLLAAALFLWFSGVAQAALIEVPGSPYDARIATGHPVLSWQDRAIQTALLANDRILRSTAGWQGHAAHEANDVTRIRDIPAHVLRTTRAISRTDADQSATMDAPYRTIDDITDLPGDSVPDAWTVLLIAAGLVAYQIRRKSRIGAISIRPLRS